MVRNDVMGNGYLLLRLVQEGFKASDASNVYLELKKSISGQRILHNEFLNSWAISD